MPPAGNGTPPPLAQYSLVTAAIAKAKAVPAGHVAAALPEIT
jgi:hypothetical protein